jgi:hypothetical protein
MNELSFSAQRAKDLADLLTGILRLNDDQCVFRVIVNTHFGLS